MPSPPLDPSEHHALMAWAIACAERVLPHFEAVCPDDPRPREALAAGRAWAKGERRVGPVRTAALAAHTAARATEDPAAKAAARAAGHAAAIAHVPDHARAVATYAVKAVAATNADPAAEVRWQRQRLPAPLHRLAFPPAAPE